VRKTVTKTGGARAVTGGSPRSSFRAVRRRFLTAALVVPALVALGACSDDDDPVLDLSGPAEVDTDGTGSVAVGDPAVSSTDVASGDLSERDPGSLAPGADNGGTVTVDGVTYTIEPEICIAEAPNVAVEGLGTAPDGTVAWVSVNRAVTRREDVTGVMDPQTITRLFGDKDEIDEIAVSVDVGKTEPVGEPSGDQPSWAAGAGVLQPGDLVVSPTTTGITATGTATDALGDGRTSPIELDVGCA